MLPYKFQATVLAVVKPEHLDESYKCTDKQALIAIIKAEDKRIVDNYQDVTIINVSQHLGSSSDCRNDGKPKWKLKVKMIVAAC